MRELGDVQSEDTCQKGRGELEGRRVSVKKGVVLGLVLYAHETHENDGYDCEDHDGSALFTCNFCLYNAGLFLFEIEQGVQGSLDNIGLFRHLSKLAFDVRRGIKTEYTRVKHWCIALTELFPYTILVVDQVLEYVEFIKDVFDLAEISCLPRNVAIRVILFALFSLLCINRIFRLGDITCYSGNVALLFILALIDFL